MSRNPTVYILTNKPKGTLYVGVTAQPNRRFWQHLSNQHPTSFVSRYTLHRLVYMEHFETITRAIAREKEIKGWSRNRKLVLIETANPLWDDLLPRVMDMA